MDRLHFGAQSRRRARLKRVALWVWVVAVAATTVGLPRPDLGVGLFKRIVGPAQPAVSVAGGIETSESAERILRFRRGVFRARPTPTPEETRSPQPAAPVVAPAPAGSITAIIYSAAAEFGIGGSYLLAVAQCESGLNPSAYNPAGYHGLFQFSQSSWAEEGYGSIYDPVAQARTAARLLAAGQQSRWPNCA